VLLVGVTIAHMPVVQMHGMGDFADNPMGMLPMRKAISERLNGTYVVNAKLANGPMADSLDTFVMVMDEEVDTFAKFVQADWKLANGFNAIGYSQGNLIIRGYIEKYNSPPVFNWVSIHGPLSGVAGMPRCEFEAMICKMFDGMLGAMVYESWAQTSLAQANYFRDPNRIEAYTQSCEFLPEINNERNPNPQYKERFTSINRLALVMADNDTMIYPKESEWFGFYEDGDTSRILSMKQTKWYQEDLFGLKTLDQANRIDTYTTPGDHLQFTEEFLMEMVDKYFANP